MVKRVGPLTGTATVPYDVTGGTATRDTGSGGDYSITAPGTLTFLPQPVAPEAPHHPGPRYRRRTGARPSIWPCRRPPGAEPRHAQPGRRDDQGQRQGRQGPVQRRRLQRGRERGDGHHHGHSLRRYLERGHGPILDLDGSAAAGTDYTATSGTLTFGFKQTSATFTIPVTDDGAPDGGAVSVDLALDTPDNGLALGSVTAATLWIVRE